ncbi:protein of unknown function DUF214 [Fibrella aestuarina BUZ 2]|uniref:Macrolide export ATP-binding/permease protein macB n=1 Tax=Fibrella aestuarina BUZ 2 TaxID=1166018 RepID=I0K278_9BACT|nr:FtsX-like permease family protein [Fibrella aestuarina]CCG98231.1 protein of unknown function DUF214 [Fibrella aestuarina BUZ 2]
MIWFTLRSVWRSWRTQLSITMINLIGLALGLAGCLLVTAYVLDEIDYDRFHTNANRIVLLQQFDNAPSSGGQFATDLKSRFATIEQAVRLTRANLLMTTPALARYEPQVFFADSSLFGVFSYRLAVGNPNTALREQYGVVLSDAMARHYFPNQNPLGQLIKCGPKATLHVTGVLAPTPANTHLRPDFLVNYANANELLGFDVTTNYWGGSDTYTYLLLAPNAQPADLASQLPAYVKSLGDPNAAIWKMALVPLRDLYLRTNLFAQNRLTYVYTFALVALLILGLAVFNYINLATARAMARAKEVGIRKALGSSVPQLWRQFLGEAALAVGVSLWLALLFTALLTPLLNEIAGKDLSVLALVTPVRLLAFALGIGALVLLAGSYPAFVLARYQPVVVLRGQATEQGTRGAALRQSLVVGQFAVSVGMIVATLVVYAQLHYVQQTNVGYQRAQVLTLDLRDAPNEAKEQFKRQVETLAGVRSATRAFGLPGSGAAIGGKLVSEFVPKGAQTGSIRRLTVDADFLKTFGIRLLEGRNFDRNRAADKTTFLVNRAAMRYFGWTTIAGKRTGYYNFVYDPNSAGGYKELPQVGEVVGLVDDYNHADLKRTVEPMIYSLAEGWESQMAVGLQAGNLPQTIQQIERTWKSQFPDRPFTYTFLDDSFNKTYQSDLRTGQVFGGFALLALLISGLGLFGLATFSTARRTKEIGVRKVLGASVGSIVALLSKDFLKLVLIAILIASPLAWWAMNQWLGTFAYKIQIEWWVFALSGTLAIAIALATVSFQSIKAALMNPVNSLRAE